METPAKFEASLVAFIPKLTTGRYTTYREGEITKKKLKRYIVRNQSSSIERIDVVWPKSAKAVGPNFLLGLFAEQLRTAATVEQFTAILQFKDFPFDEALKKAHQIATSLNKEQFERMLLTGIVP